MNGQKQASSSGSSTTDALNIQANPDLIIGAVTASGQRKSDASIAEIVVFKRQLAVHERQAVEAYLAQKWLDEPYPRSCEEYYQQGETVDGNYMVDADGYNGPNPPESVSCTFP